MGTEIAVVSGATTGYEVLDVKSDQYMARVSSDEPIGESDMLRVRVPAGGGTHWDIDGEITKEITGILCFVAKRGALFPSQTPQKGVKPVLVTNDLRVARRINEDCGDLDEAVLAAAMNPDGSYRWQDLPYTALGSAANGSGMRATESRIFCILRPGDTIPIAVSIPGGSLWSVGGWLKRLSLPSYRYVVSLGLEKSENKTGIAFSKVIPKILGQLSREEGDLVKGLYSEGLARMLGGGSIPTGDQFAPAVPF